MESKTERISNQAQARRPQPDLEDPLLAPYWAGAREHKFLLRQCQSCGEYQWPPRPMCPRCFGTDFTWAEGDGQGSVYTYTVVQRAFHPAFQELLPYILAVVEVMPDIRMLGNLVHAQPEEVRVGMKVRVEFLDLPEGTTLINWRPANV